MSPRQRGRYCSRNNISTTRRNYARHSDSAVIDARKGHQGDLRLPLETLKLLMRRCSVKLTRCDVILRNRSLVKKEVCMEQTQMKLSTSTVTVTIKKEMVDSHLNLRYGDNMHSPRDVKPDISKLWNKKYKLLLPSILLVRCDDLKLKREPTVPVSVTTDVKQPIVKNDDIMKNAKSCRVVLIRCDNNTKLIPLGSKLEPVSYAKVVPTQQSEKTVKRFPCELCDRSFLSRAAMDCHLRRHLGEKPYKCSQCPKDFSTSGERTAHSYSHSSVYSFKCKICGKQFKYHCSLCIHNKRKHANAE